MFVIFLLKLILCLSWEVNKASLVQLQTVWITQKFVMEILCGAIDHYSFLVWPGDLPICSSWLLFSFIIYYFIFIYSLKFDLVIFLYVPHDLALLQSCQNQHKLRFVLQLWRFKWKQDWLNLHKLLDHKHKNELLI